MRSWKLAVAAAGLLAAGPVLADGANPAETARTSRAPAESRHAVALGPVGHDEEGRPGRVHTVRKGDTLWDISDAYLGTPWVWPSIWTDNREIDNPHLIRPGDRIWVSPREMRRVTDAEAEALLAGRPGGLPAAFDADAMPDFGATGRSSYRVPSVHTVGFVTEDQVRGEASIVESPVDRTWLQDHDEVVIGLGAGEVAAGDKLAIFRPGERVTDSSSGRLFGFATEELGWMEVTEVRDDGATGVIRLSRAEIRRGDHVRPLAPRQPEIAVGPRLDVDGRIVYTPDARLHMGTIDVVYLDRGTDAGLAVGSPLEVFRPLGTGRDEVAEKRVAVPDRIVAKLLVVETHPEASVAVVTHTTHELVRGDRFRGTSDLTW